MCALMGASGAGKSTLLDVLAARKTTGEIAGDILFNGASRTASIMRSSAYVMQDNVHIGVLTVRQTLNYAAALRLSEKMTAQGKTKRVDKILDMLGLAEHADTLVGNEYIRGISGGQLKRLSIGVEIVHLPDLIFLDEPTTGKIYYDMKRMGKSYGQTSQWSYDLQVLTARYLMKLWPQYEILRIKIEQSFAPFISHLPQRTCSLISLCY